MADERQVNDVLVYRDSAGFYRERPLDASGTKATSSNNDRDTDGNLVPTNKAHAFTYDNSGNLITDTVTDGTGTGVRTYTASYNGGKPPPAL